MKKENTKTNQTTQKITSKQVVAMIGVILLILMYVVTFILSIVDNSSSVQFFALSLCCTLVIPIIIFLYSWMYGRITGNKAIGDPESASDDTDVSE